MKKILAIILFIFISVTNSFAVFFVDGFGANVDAGDLETQYGFGGGLGFSITSDLNFLFRSTWTSLTENKDKIDETDYEHFTAFGGVEYTPKIPLLSKYRLNWRNSILAGFSNSEVSIKNVEDGEVSDSGFACCFWTGIQYDLTQIVSPFLDLGYHSSFYINDFDDDSVRGYQIALGIRFYLTGSRDYTSDYN